MTAPLVLVVSDGIYQSIVRHNYDGIDPLRFTTFMTKRNSATWDSGWLHVPSQSSHTFIDGAFAAHPSVTS